MSIVIVYGPMASGKTTNKNRLKQHYKCNRIVDDWDDTGMDFRKLKDGDLVLTTSYPPFSVPSAVSVEIKTALRAMGGKS